MPSQTLSFLIHRRQKRQKSWQPRLGRVGMGCGALASLLLICLLLPAALAYANLTADLPSHQLLPRLLNLQDGSLLQPTTLTDRTGQHVLLTINNPGIQRRYLSANPDQPDHFSPYLIQVTLALLDESFWQNPGFAWWDLADRSPLTLTERLAADLLLETEPPALRRSLRMRLLAAQLVANYGRSQVLEWYLNSAYFGNLAYGAESASQLYLGKPASALTVAEAALLVPVSQAPALNPLSSPAAALERQQAALAKLLSMGVINPTEYQHALNSPLHLQPAPTPPTSVAEGFSRLVVDRLSRQLGSQRVERGGMRITTTLDYDLQVQLECTLRAQLMRLQGQETASAASADGAGCAVSRLLPTLPPGSAALPPELAAGAILLELESGQVLAYGSPITTAPAPASYYRYQPGSMLTPWVAVAAFARGFSPASMVLDIPSNVLDEAPANPDRIYHGPQRLRLALANDYLPPLTELLRQLGAENVWRQAELLGLTRLSEDPKPAELLVQGGSLPLLDLAQAYSVFANLGALVGVPAPNPGDLTPVTVMEVKDAFGGQGQDDRQLQRRSVLSPELAYLIHHILTDEHARWLSLGYPNPLEVGRPVGAKVGQAAGGSQVWAVGYTPQRLALVWLGFPQGMVDAPQLQPRQAAGIWHAIIQYASRDLPPGGWQPPPGISAVKVCDPSGKLPTAACPLTVDEVFLDGNEPVEYDSLYRALQINRETGRLATVFTPLELIQEEVFLTVPAEALEWARAAGLPLPPAEYDDILAPPTLPDVNITEPPIFSTVNGRVTLIGTAAGEGFTSYRLQVGEGLNPRTWRQIDQEIASPVESGKLGVWDTSGYKDGLYSLRLTVLRADQRLDSAVTQLVVDNTPPAVQVVYPLRDQRLAYPVERQITFRAEISDPLEIQRVRWWLNGRQVGESSQSPFSFSWIGSPGSFTLVAEAVDLAGNAGKSQPVTFTLAP